MTRHQRNSTASTVYTHHERKKDAKASGYGTLHERLTKEAVKDFDCCSLTLQPCRDPVVTPEGHLYDKEAILENIIHQKREIARKQKEYEKQIRKDETELQELARAERESKAKKFVAAESTPAHPGNKDDANTSAAGSSGLSNMSGAKAKQVPSFWVPSVAGSPDVKATKIEKPDTNVFCPMSGKPFKLKDLITVIFTPIDDDDKPGSTAGKKERYKCAVSGDVLTNSTPCAVLKTSGNVVTMDVVERVIMKDRLDPTNGKPITEDDIIRLQRGGTGFASANETLFAKLARPVMELA